MKNSGDTRPFLDKSVYSEEQIQAISSLYKEYVDDLFHYGQRITGNRELIKDSIQDLFVDIWTHRRNLSKIRSMRFYLFKALKRIIIRKLKRERKLSIDENYSLEENTFDIVLSHESKLIAEQISVEQQKQIIESLNKLPRRQKEALTLKFYGGFSYKEVAIIMSMSVNSTYNLIYRSIANLKHKLLKNK